MSLLNGVVICLVSGMLSAKICTPFKILHLALLSFATLQCQEDTFFYCIPFLQRSQTVFLCTFRVLDINEMNSDVLSMFLKYVLGTLEHTLCGYVFMRATRRRRYT